MGRKGVCIWRENEEMSLWQVDLKEWQLSETAQGDGMVQWIWAKGVSRHTMQTDMGMQ